MTIAMPPTRAAETGASWKVADFLLAWWNGDDNGHFPLLHICNLDETISEDLLIVMAYLSQHSTVYAGDWGYAEAMAELWTRYRGEDWRRERHGASSDKLRWKASQR